ncbi:sugar ABC transporter substrate-binding protein [Neobacillus mesonae]|uniref:sugar ABC transporter substrate-binding protein n=1 Tax=Neobacillus mesonae TaxID=1193713 RepID=UPI00203A4F20|nr:sugar ABC transporter substrate-binding protein [Neobacillus mesonae]MCM3569878.1 sugar ABC transporter substrate-binding protein [Neobacillus mesonae]
MKKSCSFLVIALLTIMSILSGCSSSTSGKAANEGGKSKNDHYKFGIVLKQLNTEYWKIVMAGAKDAAKKYDVDIEFLGPTSENLYEDQIKMIEDQIATGVDALIVAPSQSEAVLPVLNSAQQKNIPVLLVDSDANFKDKVSFIGTGNLKAAKLGGEFLSDKVKNGDKVAILRGQMGSKTFDDRVDGFKSALKDKNIKFIIQDAQHDREKSVNVMENILTANPDVKAVFAASDEMALGAVKALKNEGRTDIPVIGFDGTPNGLAALQKGDMVANVAQNPYMMGYLSVETAYKAKKGETVKKRINSGAKVITKENVTEEIGKIKKYLGEK